ncbi:MAG: FKBP-type peptidyl-prolyl cis-trans isomerase [Paludibacteraceae bacterium]|nr:FKBP-type peptidyl-prolyl cis-trans isomerase [Paludibacteraceae bacterium]MBR6041181.1 FKBP-type peptidyl-prolyl cis-trans isomerase [Paludibacteraceae bacterium]MCR5569924.1 FKBP-type peptidyl-prolyl cis-trans isomerase [Paludibacteraceae bacterium]
MKKHILTLLTVMFWLNGMAATKIRTSQDSISYALGYVVGGQQLSKSMIERYGCSKETFLKAVQDALNNDSTTMTQVMANDYMHKAEMKYLTKSNMKKDAAYREAKGRNNEYLSSIKRNSQYKELPNSWDSTACGVLRKILKQGSGEKPTISSAVKFNYSYKLVNGTLISQSKNGEPIEGLVRNLLPGLQDALVEMPVGSRWEIVIPSELAFDKDEQTFEDGHTMVPANSILIFDVELLNTGTPEDIDYYGN